MKDTELEELRKAQEVWSLQAKNELAAKKQQIRDYVNDSRQEVKPLYTPDDIADTGYLRDIGFPGQYPFTRGIYPFGYRARPWRYRLYSGFFTAEDTNQRWKRLIAAGDKGMTMAQDLPSQMGIDSDDPRADGQVGRVGMAVDTLKDFEIAYDGIPLDQVACSFAQTTLGALFIAMLVATAEKQGVSLSQITGTIHNAGLQEFLGRGAVIFPERFAVKLGADLAEYSIRNMPKFYPFQFVGGGAIAWSGSSSAEEVGFALSCGYAYIEELLKRGIDIDDLAPRLSLALDCTVRFLEHVAKLRATRRIWARHMKERYGAKKKESMMCRMTGSPSGVEYTAVEPELNLVRQACGIIGCALAGVQGVVSPTYQELYGCTDEQGSLWVMRVEQIIAEETDATSTVDPLGGSYFIEAMTNEHERAILKIIEEVDAQGGALKAIENGYIQRRITASSIEYQRELESGRRVRVGENKYVIDREQPSPSTQGYDPTVAVRQLERLRQVKAERDQSQVDACLQQVKKAAEEGTNLMQPFINAVKAYATVGEICNVLKSVVGEYRPIANVF